MITSCLRKFHLAIVSLQETHLTRDTVNFLQNPRVGKAYHSTHSAYSCGVSVLIHKSLAFQVLDSLIDPLGCCVFLHCKLFTLTLIIAFVYIPPPFSREILQLLLSYLVDKPEVPILIIGDFNGYLDPRLDRQPPVQPPSGKRGTVLNRLLAEVGWTGVWRLKYPTTKQFSCFSKTHVSISRIDLCVGSSHVLNHVSKVEYFPRGVSFPPGRTTSYSSF